MPTEPLHGLIFAQVIGLFLVIMTIIMVVRADYYRKLMMNLNADSGLIPVSASIVLVFGLSLIVMHNVWVWESDTLITIVAWVLVIKSVLWLALPERMVVMSHKLYGSYMYYIVAFIIAVVGVLLMTHGYYLYMPR